MVYHNYLQESHLGSDSIFHYNRFYEAAMQLKMVTFLLLSLYGFQQSAGIVNAYGPFFAYLQEGLF